MATAGYCHQCGAYVYLDEQWSCPNGHGWNAVSGWYDADTREPVTPPWVGQRSDQTQPAPESPSPPDPAVVLRGLIRECLEELNLAVVESDDVYSASRGEEYECAVAVDGANGRVRLWERLRTGRDPGVRDALRAIGGANWALKIVLRRGDVAG